MDKIKLIQKETAGIKGVHVLSLCDIVTQKARALEKLVDSAKTWEEFNHYREQLFRLFLKKQWVVDNLTCVVGRSVLAQRLANTTTYTGVVNYCALGTSATAPTVSDTQLNTETYRKASSPATYLSNVAYLETFFAAADVNGTFQEYGNVIDGSSGANTGQLFNHFTQAITKSSTQSLNVQSIITFSNV